MAKGGALNSLKNQMNDDLDIHSEYYAKGGMIEIDEDGGNIPSELMQVFSDFNEDEDSYKEMERLRLKAKEIGYDFDYDLSGQPTEFMKIDTYAKGGGVKEGKYKVVKNWSHSIEEGFDSKKDAIDFSKKYTKEQADKGHTDGGTEVMTEVEWRKKSIEYYGDDGKNELYAKGGKVYNETDYYVDGQTISTKRTNISNLDTRLKRFYQNKERYKVNITRGKGKGIDKVEVYQKNFDEWRLFKTYIPTSKGGSTYAKGGDVSKMKDHLVIDSKDKIVFEGTKKQCESFSDTYLEDYTNVVDYWDLSDDKEYFYAKGGSIKGGEIKENEIWLLKANIKQLGGKDDGIILKEVKPILAKHKGRKNTNNYSELEKQALVGLLKSNIKQLGGKDDKEILGDSFYMVEQLSKKSYAEGGVIGKALGGIENVDDVFVEGKYPNGDEFYESQYTNNADYVVNDWLKNSRGLESYIIFARMNDGEEIEIQEFRNGGYYDKGGRTISIVNDGVKYDKSKYKAVYGDYDKDGVVNIDDANPLNKNKKGKVEEIELKNTFDKLLGVKAELDTIMYDAVDTLDEKAPKGADIYARTKTPYSILKKLVEKRMLDPKKGLTDMIGTTIAVDNQKELVELRDKIDNGLLGKVLDRDDFYKKPNAGYRAYHYIVEYKGVPVEVQLKTKNMKKLHEVSHKAYKNGNLDAKSLDFVSKTFMKADKGDSKAKAEIDRLLKDKKQLISKITKD